MKHKYEAVTTEQLTSRLGSMCSPMSDRKGYVIGPDITGRLCHIATCFSIKEAQDISDSLNKKYGEGK